MMSDDTPEEESKLERVKFEQSGGVYSVFIMWFSEFGLVPV